MTSINSNHMRLSFSALFTYDSQGRMLRVNEPDGDVAPRFLLGRTTEGNLWRFRHDLPQSLVDELNVICRHEPVAFSMDILREPPKCFDEINQLLQSHAPVSDVYAGPEFRFPEVLTVSNDAAARQLTIDDTAQLQPHFPWLIDEMQNMPPVFGVEQDGMIVSVCFSSRTTPAADEAGVNTVPAYRGRRFAPACVAAWADAIRSLRRTPLYGTTWDNAASRGVARRLGLIMFGAVLHLH